MTLRVLQSGPCTSACAECSHRSPRLNCDGHNPCPGYGTSSSCPPLIVLAVHECLDLNLLDLTHIRTAHA